MLNKKEESQTYKETINFLQDTKNGEFTSKGEIIYNYERVCSSRDEYNVDEQYFYSIT